MQIISKILKIIQMLCGYKDLLLYSLVLKHKNHRELVYYDLSKNPHLFDASSRIPEVLKSLPRSLIKNAAFSAGKVIEFESNSDVVDIHIIYKKISIIDHMKYDKASAVDVVSLAANKETTYVIQSNSPVNMHVNKKIEVINQPVIIKVYLPSYAVVSKVFVGVNKNSIINNVCEKKGQIVFYGSSITQGCCASSPQKSYTSIVANYYNLQQKNFGFSESAKGENEIIDYIASIPAVLYILEYDHNASLELLSENHYKVYSTIRKKNQRTPIILMSRFSGGLSETTEEEVKREHIIEQTVSTALKNGDKKVYFVSGKDVIKNKEKYFVDDRHPNDEGMMIIAGEIISCIQKNNLLVKEK